MSVLEKQPVFSLQIETFGVKYYLKVNGVTLLREYSDDGQLSTELPINQWIHPKINNFGFDIFPGESGGEFLPGAKLDITLIIKDNSDDSINIRVPLLNFSRSRLDVDRDVDSDVGDGGYTISGNEFTRTAGDADIYLLEVRKSEIADFQGAFSYRREVEMENSLPLWKFFSSDDLPDYFSVSDDEYYAEQDSLYLEYSKLRDLINKNELDLFLDLCDERSQEIDRAFYKRSGETRELLARALKNNIGSNDFELGEIKKEWLGVTPEEGGKIVSLTRKGEKAAIGFQRKSGGSESYPILFRKEKGKWIITR